MDVPPPLPPNRPTTKRRIHNSSSSDVQWREKKSLSPPAQHNSLSPRHSWGGNSSKNLPLPPLPPPISPARAALSNPPATLPDSPTPMFPKEDEKFTLSELVDNYSSLFPIKICVVKGFYSDRGEDSAIAVDELYNFHFVKRAKVVSIKDSSGGKFVVPLNSSAKFGVMYEGGATVFGTVEEIMNAPSLPRVVSVGTGYVGNTSDSSVCKHELLVVHAVEKAGRFRRKASTLRVFSISKNVEKNLTKDVYGKFSTDPFRTQMYLPDYLKHIRDPIPSSARLYLDFESGDPLPDYLTSESVTLSRLYVETSIIATFLAEEDLHSNAISSSEGEQTVDIPISLDIEVSIIPPVEEEDDYERLTIHTMNLFSQFDPTKAKATLPVDDEEDEDYSTIQNNIFKSVRKGFEKEGLNIEMPSKVRSLSLQVQEKPNDVGSGEEEGREHGSDSEDSVDLDGYEDMSLIDQIRSESLPRDITPPLPPPFQSSSPQHSLSPRKPRPYEEDVSLLRQIRKRPPLPTPSNEEVKPPTNRPTSASASTDSPGKAAPRRPQIRKQSSDPVQHAPTTPAEKEAPLPPPPVKPKSPSRSSLLKINTMPRSVSGITEKVPPPNIMPRSVSGITEKAPPPNAMPRSVSGITEKAPPPGNDSRVSSDRGARTSTEDVASLQSSLHDLASRVKHLEAPPSTETSALKPQIERVLSLAEKLEGDMLMMQEDLKHLKAQVEELTAEGHRTGGGSESGREINPELAALDCHQVQKLLELMGLSRHQESFQYAGVDGTILAECDDRLLQEELDVSFRLDRIKLLQLISGKRSAQNILQKSSYVAFQPRN